MDAILQGLSGIFEVVLIAGLGFYLAKTGWLWETAGKDLTRLTMTVSLPPLMIYSLKSNFTHDQLIEKGGFYADLYNSQFEDVVE